MPFFDVVIPAAGSGAFFAETVDSLLRQSLQDFRVFVFENGISHSVYRDVVASTGDDRFQFIRSDQRLDIVTSTYRCIQLVRSNFGVVLHDDDVWSPNVLESTKVIANGAPEVTGIVCSWVHCPFLNRQPVIKNLERLEFWKRCSSLPEKPMQLLLTTGNSRVHMSALFFKGDNRLGPHPASLWNFDARLGQSIGRFGKIALNAEALVYIRTHENSMTKQVSNPAGTGGLENFELSRDGVIALQRYRGEISDNELELAATADPNPMYWRDLTRVCFSCPPRWELVKLGRQIVRLNRTRKLIGKSGVVWSVLLFLPSIFWTLLDCVAQFRWYRNEKTSLKTNRPRW